MIDQIYDRQYQASRIMLNQGIDLGLARLVRSARIAFSALNRIQFSAPWIQRSRRATWS